MKVRVAILEIEIFSLEWTFKEPTLADVLADLGVKPDADVSESDTKRGELTSCDGGQFERDTAPLAPEDRYRELWDDKFGFGT